MDMETVITGPLPHRDSNYVILDAAHCASIYQQLVELGIEVGETPRDFLYLQGTHPRQLYHFDPNQLFDFFDEVVIDPRFMLEFLYHRDLHGGRSLFYTRKRFVAPFIDSPEIYQLLFCGLERPYLHHIRFSFSPRGIFQFLLFVKIIERLYANVDPVAEHLQLVFFNPQRDKLLCQCETGWSDEDKSAFLNLDLRPRIQMTANYAVVQAYQFSTEQGVAEIEYRIEADGRRVEQLSCEQVIDLQTISQVPRQPNLVTDSEVVNDSSYPPSAVVLQ